MLITLPTNEASVSETEEFIDLKPGLNTEHEFN